MPIPFLIPAIAALAGGIISAVSSARQNKKTNQANLELAKYSYGQQKEQIDAQNVYNSPVSQMARYSDAGLNPNLIYGQGSSGNQQSIPQFEAPRQDYRHNVVDLPGMLEQFNNIKMQQAQIDNVKASTEARRTNTATELVKRMGIMAGVRNKDFDLFQKKRLADYQVDIVHGKSQAAYSELQMVFERLRQMKSMNPLLLAEKEQQLRIGQSEEKKREADALFQQLRAQMFKNHSMTPSDNVFLRMLIHAIQDMGIDVNQEKIMDDLHIRK